MSFGSNTNKHKSGFGVDGSQINPKDPNKNKKPDFAASQKIDKAQLQVKSR
jgi:hypothetical protein